MTDTIKLDTEVAEVASAVRADLRHNLGTRRMAKLQMAKYPDAGPAIRAARQTPVHKVDVLLVNPPSPDGAVWIRSQHRVGRRSRENMIWPQVSLAQLAAVMHPTYTVRVIDAVADRLGPIELASLEMIDEVAQCEIRLAAQAVVERREPTERLLRHRCDVGAERHRRGAIGLGEERAV